MSELIQTPILTTEHPLFNSVWKIYTDSFPCCERRHIDHLKDALRSPYYHMEAWCRDEHTIGLLCYWEFDRYIYLEHLAVTSQLRGAGVGRQIVEHLIHSTSKLLILEAELPTDSLSQRRIGFYQRIGFYVNHIEHFQHLYHSGDRPLKMLLLSYPGPIDRHFYRQFDHHLHRIVMHRTTPMQP